MMWLAWRRQRTETLMAAGVLALLAAWLVPTGLEMARAYDHQGVGACLNGRDFTCGQVVDSFTRHYAHGGLLQAAFNFLPGLVGVLLAAALLLELEQGTYRLAWTQSVTRGRWLAWKLGLLVGTGVAVALVLSALFTWWRGPLDKVQGRLSSGNFDLEGTVMIGYVLFALGLALAVGVIWRRAVAALVIGFAGYSALRIFVDSWLRQRFMAPQSVTWQVGTGNRSPIPRDAWVLNEYPSDRLGHHVVAVRRCFKLESGCLIKPLGGYIHSVYQPASRFWAFQGVETALFTVLALLLVAFAAWWVRARVT